MKYNLIVRSLAEDDMTDALNWYFKIDSTLAQEFLSQLDSALNKIQSQPLHYQVRYKTIRWIRIKKFPFFIHFSIVGNHVFVHAVLHSSRNPSSWKDR